MKTIENVSHRTQIHLVSRQMLKTNQIQNCDIAENRLHNAGTATLHLEIPCFEVYCCLQNLDPSHSLTVQNSLEKS